MQGLKQAFRRAALLKRWYIPLLLVCTCLGHACPLPATPTAAFFQDKNQRVSLRVYRASLRQVFRMIEKQTGLTFAVSSTALENAAPVTLNVQQAPLTEVLRRIFANTRYAYEIRNKQIIVYPLTVGPPAPGVPGRTAGAEPERFTVSGIITDGEKPLAGVSIREKETRNGASTSENGRFRLSVNSGQAVLQISLIGYEPQEIPLRERRYLDVTLLSDMKTLNDLVIIGYGIQNKANITGAIAKVEGRRLKSRPVTNVMAALQGTAPGLLVTRNNGQPGKEGFNIQIRGLSSGNNSEPLVLVDGAPGSISLLNPNDIESVSVLKDASAASIYGPLAAGGVVLVNTKRGKSGRISVEYNSLFGFEKPINLPDRMHSWQAAGLLNEAARNAGQPPVWSEEQIALMKDPSVDYLPKADGSGNYDYYYDQNPLNNITRNNSTTQTYNVTARGGNDNNQYLLSLGHFARQGLFKTGPDNTSRTNIQLNANNRFSRVLSLETSLQFAENHTLSPSWRVDGNYGLLNFLYQAPGNVPVYVPGTRQYAAGFNSQALLEAGGRRDERSTFADAVFTLKAEEVLKGLTLKAVYSPQWLSYRDGLGRNTVPLYNGSGHSAGINDPNSLKRSRITEQQHSLQLLADYDIPAGKEHSVHILGGYAFESHLQQQQTGRAYGLSANEIAQLAFDNATQVTQARFSGAGMLNSWFARVNYNYKDRYLLEANLVGASLFFNSSMQPDMNRQHLFPSFSAGWRLNNEKWFGKALPFFDEFKLRGSWGMLGNFNWRSALNDFNYWDQLTHPPYYPGIRYNDGDRYIPGNNNWETISTTNVGLDMAFLKGRLNLNADYFIKNNRNMQVPAQVYPVNNLLPPRFYKASMRSWGWELNLGWRDNRGPFSYWLNANLFDDQNKILENNGPTAWLEGPNLGLPGLPYNALLGYRSAGYFQSQAEVAGHAFQDLQTAPGDIRYEDVNKDGVINGGQYTQQHHGDLVYLGSTQPRFSYGFDAGFSWKGLDFSVFFQGIGQRKMMIAPRFSMPFTESWRQPWQIHANHWTPDNPDAAFPRLYQGYNQNLLPSSFWVMNGAYIRLKNLQVGYTFHFNSRPAIMSNMRIYFSGQDLWEVNRMKIKYYDPEQSTTTGFEYPFFRSFTLGVNMNF